MHLAHSPVVLYHTAAYNLIRIYMISMKDPQQNTSLSLVRALWAALGSMDANGHWAGLQPTTCSKGHTATFEALNLIDRFRLSTCLKSVAMEVEL